jgi:lysophospholipase L1-like esterase
MFNIFDIPKWSQVSNPCYYRSINSEQLLITVGDSWTYGDSLGQTRVRDGKDDPDYRLTHVYGSLIANELHSDWINLALPGASNHLVISWLEQLLSRHVHSKDTVCVITLTETGRHEEINWLNSKLTTLQINLESMLDRTYANIKQLQKQYPSIKFILAHNFSDSRPTTLQMCNQNWLEIMTGTQIQNNTHVVVSEHIEQLNYDFVYPDTPDLIDRALQRVDILDNCQYTYKEDSRHPTEHGHKLWADYLLTQI